MGWGKVTSFRHYDDYWRKSRRLANVGLSKQAAERYHESQAKDAHIFLQRLVAKPEEWEKELHRYFSFNSGSRLPESLTRTNLRLIATTVMRITYGYPVNDSSDPLVKIVYEALGSLQALHFTSKWFLSVVQRFPIICSLPTWLPGMGWKRRLMKERHWPEKLSGLPWEWTKQQLVSDKSFSLSYQRRPDWDGCGGRQTALPAHRSYHRFSKKTTKAPRERT
jgi:hypothetical protein